MRSHNERNKATGDTEKVTSSITKVFCLKIVNLNSKKASTYSYQLMGLTVILDQLESNEKINQK